MSENPTVEELTNELNTKVRALGNECLSSFSYYVKIPNSNVMITLVRINETMFSTIISFDNNVKEINYTNKISEAVEAFICMVDAYNKLVQERLDEKNKKEGKPVKFGNEKLN